MAQKKIYQRKGLLFTLMGVILLGVSLLGLYLSLQHPPFQRYLLTRVASGSGYLFHADDFDIRYNEGVEIKATHLDVENRHSKSRLAANETTLTLDLKALLKGQFIIQRLEMNGAHIDIVRNFQKEDSTSGDIKPKTTGKSIRPEAFVSKIPKDLYLSDTTIKIAGLDYQFDEVAVSVKPTPDDPARQEVVVSSRITTPSERARLELNGWITRPHQTDNDIIGALKINIDQLPLKHLPKNNSISFQAGMADLAVDLTIDKTGAALSKGMVFLTNPSFRVQNQSRHKTYHLPQAQLNYEARLTEKAFTLDPVKVKTPDATLFCSYGFDWQDIKAPRMELVVSSDEMPLATLKSIFPTPLISGWIHAEIFPLFSSGSARLEEFSLKGPVAAIQRLGRKENENSLYLDIRLTDTAAFQERPGPVVNNVSGRIQIKEGAFIVSDVAGETGETVLTNSGYTIPDLYERPSRHVIALAGNFDLNDIKAWHAWPIFPGIILNQLASFDTLSGQASGNATLYLKGPKATGLTGDLTLAGNSIDRDDTVLPVTVDTGRIQIAADSAASIVAQGDWGKSAVEIKGTFDLAHFLLGLPRRHNDQIDLIARWNLAELAKISRQNKLAPQWLANLKEVRGSVHSDLTISQTAEHKGWQYHGGDFKFQQIYLDHGLFKKPVTTNNGRFSLTAEGTGQFAVNGAWGKSAFDLSGRFTDFFGRWSTKGKARLETADLTTVLAGTVFPSVSADKPIPIQWDIHQTDGKWSLLADLAMDSQDITIGDFNVTPPATGNRLHSEFTWRNGQPVTVKKLQWVHQKKTLDIRGKAPKKDNQPTQFELVAEKFPLKQIGLKHKRRLQNLSGELTSQVSGEITGNRLETLKLYGPLKIQDTQLPVSGTPLLGQGWDVDITFNGTAMTVHPSTLPISSGERLQLSGNLTGWKKMSGKLTVTLDKLHLDHWTKRRKKPAGQKQPSPKTGAPKPAPWAIKPDISISLFAPTVLWNNRSIGQLKAELDWKGYDCHLYAIDLEGSGVAVNMSGRYGWPLSDQAGLSLLTYVSLDGIDSDRFLSGLGVKKNDVHGTLDLEGGLEIKGKTAPELAQSASGRFKLNLSDGYIREPNVLIKVLEIISIENIFIKKPPDALKDQFYYKSIDADFILEEGILTTENFFMKSPVFNMGATGQLDMSNMNLNLILAAQPLNTLDAIVSRIPIAGHILTGKNKALLVYTFEVDGTLNDPSVHQKPFKNLDKAVVGYFQRIFLTPSRVVSKIGSFLDDITKKLNITRRAPHEGGGDH